MAHEFRHGYSYLNGELMPGGMLTDITDEVNAYKADYLFLDRKTAGLVAGGFYNVDWFNQTKLNTNSSYAALKGKEVALSTNTLASIVMKYNPNDRINFFLNINKNNANINLKQAMQSLNGNRNPLEFRYESLLKNR